MTPQPPNCVASRRGFTDHMLRSVGICLAALLFLLDDVSGQELEPVSVCPTRSIPANRSGIITYDPTSGGCTLTLTGLQSGVRISLMGVSTSAATAELCNSLGYTSVRLNGLPDLNCATTKVDVYKNVIAITGSDELTLEVVAPGSAAIQTPYFPAYRCGGSDATLYPNEVGGLTATYTSQLYAKSVPDAEDCNSTMTGLPAGQIIRFTTSVKIFTENQASLTADGIELAGEGEFTDVPVPDNQRIDIQYASHALATPRAEYFFHVEVLTCGSPPPAPDGEKTTIVPEMPWLLGTVVEYLCEANYMVMDDNSMRVCEKTNVSDPEPRWSQNNITCVPVPYCFETPPTYRHSIGTRNPDNRTVNYNCEMGSTSSSLPFIVSCGSPDPFTEPYYWTEPTENLTCSGVPYCFDAPPTYPKSISTRNPDNKTVLYECDLGYTSSHLPFSLNCELPDPDMVFYSWTEPTVNLECTKVPCSHPPDVEHGSSTADPDINYFYMDSLTYICDANYFTSDDPSIQCQSDGKWEPAPTCLLSPTTTTTTKATTTRTTRTTRITQTTRTTQTTKSSAGTTTTTIPTATASTTMAPTKSKAIKTTPKMVLTPTTKALPTSRTIARSSAAPETSTVSPSASRRSISIGTTKKSESSSTGRPDLKPATKNLRTGKITIASRSNVTTPSENIEPHIAEKKSSTGIVVGVIVGVLVVAGVSIGVAKLTCLKKKSIHPA